MTEPCTVPRFVDATTNPYPPGECPVERTLNVVGRRWVGQVLWTLLSGRKRHGQLLEAIGAISSKVLTDRLRELENAGFLTREVFAEVPPRVEYELTDRGRSLASVFDAMSEWGQRDLRSHEGSQAAQVREPN